MNVESLTEAMDSLSDKAMAQFAKRYICQSLHAQGKEAEEVSVALDLIHAECAKRGIEKYYDMTYEQVIKHPEMCNAA